MKRLWRRWSYEIPLAVGDALWEVLVVRLAARLDRLTLRQAIAFIPVVILVLAYYHRIPLPPELMLVGDLLAYIDIFSVLFLLGVLSRAATILFIIKQATGRAASLVTSVFARLQRLDARHRRAGAAGTKPRRKQDCPEDDRAAGAAWGMVAIA